MHQLMGQLEDGQSLMALARLAQMTGTSLHCSPFIQKVSLAMHGGSRVSRKQRGAGIIS